MFLTNQNLLMNRHYHNCLKICSTIPSTTNNPKALPPLVVVVVAPQTPAPAEMSNLLDIPAPPPPNPSRGRS
jgi:hypothetical protein